MKQKIITKESERQLKDKFIIEKKIKELKDQFKKHTSNRIEEMYKILCKIVQLRQGTTKSRGRYTERSLEWENDLKLNGPQIRYIFSYKHFSDKSKQLVSEGKIDDSSICCLIWRFRILREAPIQNKIVQAYLEKKIKISDLTEMNTKDIIAFINTGKINLSDTERHVISAIKTIRSAQARMKSYKVKEMETKYKDSLIRSLESFLEYLK